MERLEFAFAAGQPAAGRTVSGVVSSGDLEVLLEPAQDGRTTVAVQTSVDGYGATWSALLERVFGTGSLPAARIEINDNGATPGVVRMRIEQAYEQVSGQMSGQMSTPAAGGRP